jgi:hypothetical protein
MGPFGLQWVSATSGAAGLMGGRSDGGNRREIFWAGMDFYPAEKGSTWAAVVEGVWLEVSNVGGEGSFR